MEGLRSALEIIQESEQFDSNRAFRLFQDRVRPGGKDRDISSLRYLIDWKNFIKYAAIVIFCILAGYKYFSLKNELPKYCGISQVMTPNGGKTDLVLLDGTRVILNSGSKIELLPGFGDKDRVVKLCGEAFFDVAHDSLCPFFVEINNNIKVKVLGTKFNVNAYSTNDEIQVNLLEGAVEMTVPQSKTKTINLRPKQIALYNQETKTLSVKPQDDDSSISWLNNELVFNNETFEQIAYKMERKFNVKINIHNDLIKRQRFKGDFVNGESIDQIFKIIAADKRYKYEIIKSEINVY